MKRMKRMKDLDLKRIDLKRLDIKRWKNILRNCPYLIVLIITWLFMTVGGILLMLYRDYSGFEPDTFWTQPFFAVVMETEMNDGINSVVQTGNQAQEALALLKGSDDRSGWMFAGISGVIYDSTKDYIAKAEEAKAEEITEPEVDDVVGQTLFTTYEPQEIDSIYYSDAGKVALTTEYPYVKVEEDYFDDAIFFGDSRTLGISDYSGLNADFYCENGMTIYKLLDEKGVVCQATGERDDLNQVLQQKKYGKIYIMLGMNELGYRDTAYFLEQYAAVLLQLREWQPEAVIYLQANLHVSREKNNIKTEFNNININDKNAAIATLADGKGIFYLDVNPLFTDSEGYLNGDLTFDGVHLFAQGYMTWRDFLMEHAVVVEED